MFDRRSSLTFLFWLISGIIIFLFIYLLTKLFPAYGMVLSFLWTLFAPFVIAAFIAYLLHPMVEKMHEQRVPKALAILSIYVVFFGVIGFGVYRFYPVIVHELRDLSDQLPQLMEMYGDIVYKVYEYTSFLPETVHDKMDSLLIQMEDKVDHFIGKMVGGLTKIVDMVILLTVIPVLVFYFLKDFSMIKNYIKNWIPRKYQGDISTLVKSVDDSLGKYLRGLFIITLFVMVTTFIVLHLLHIEYALLLAIIMGVMNIIPYFGPIIGLVPVILITITVSTKKVIIVVISFLVIQLVESNLISPYVFGKSIHIHPVVIIFALLFGGEIAGVIGMILAVPLLTICKVVLTHFIQIKRKN